MPFITVRMYPGRTRAQKDALVSRITEAFVETCGGTEGGVWVVLDEVARENWAVGGRLGSNPPPESSA